MSTPDSEGSDAETLPLTALTSRITDQHVQASVETDWHDERLSMRLESDTHAFPQLIVELESDDPDYDPPVARTTLTLRPKDLDALADRAREAAEEYREEKP